MEPTDARKLSQNAQEALRLRAIKAVVVDGKKIPEAAVLFGVSRAAVSSWKSAVFRKVMCES
ncbi:MAG: helix-turn-helix domain-containing protein [Alphaproteobacteria bacterium]|nr:helix-turn-helix domain-containing protein [Alphaproteobacteria bacterium]